MPELGVHLFRADGATAAGAYSAHTGPPQLPPSPETERDPQPRAGGLSAEERAALEAAQAEAMAEASRGRDRMQNVVVFFAVYAGLKYLVDNNLI